MIDELFEVRGDRAYLVEPRVAPVLENAGIVVEEDEVGPWIHLEAVPKAEEAVLAWLRGAGIDVPEAPGRPASRPTPPAAPSARGAGRPWPRREAPTSPCPRCGNPLREGDSVCIACGKIIEAV